VAGAGAGWGESMCVSGWMGSVLAPRLIGILAARSPIGEHSGTAAKCRLFDPDAAALPKAVPDSPTQCDGLRDRCPVAIRQCRRKGNHQNLQTVVQRPVRYQRGIQAIGIMPWVLTIFPRFMASRPRAEALGVIPFRRDVLTRIRDLAIALPD
jgi:hypothetical protein